MYFFVGIARSATEAGRVLANDAASRDDWQCFDVDILTSRRGQTERRSCGYPLSGRQQAACEGYDQCFPKKRWPYSNALALLLLLVRGRRGAISNISRNVMYQAVIVVNSRVIPRIRTIHTSVGI
jgi:hypothetical protein